MTSNQKRSVLLIVPGVVLFLLQSVPHVGAQSPPPPDGYPYADFNPSIVTIIVILVAALFLMAFFSIYIRRRSIVTGGSIRRAFSIRRAVAAPRGLDASVMETFPTFVYSSVKGLKIGKGALECAVCLNEYEDEETLRLIPKCDHVFHPECIDAWFENHVTCPVCRANLVPVSGESGGAPEELESGVSADEQQQTTAADQENDDVPVPVSVSISIADDPVVNVQEPANQSDALNRNQSVKPSRSVRGIPRFFEKFRSHSTGHSLVQPGENLDRFTLRLPEDVRKQVVSRALLNRMGSTVRMTGEGSEKKGYRTAGVGSGRRKSYRRLQSLETVAVRSERWGLSRAPSFLTRAISVMSPKVLSGNGEASTSSTSPKTGDKIPLNNMGPKSC